MTPQELQQFRDQIDALDDQILPLLAKRAALVQEVGRRKHLTSAPVFRPEREVAIMERMVADNPGPLTSASIATIWLEIISACRALERVMRITTPPGSESAARLLFGHLIALLPASSPEEAMALASQGEADCALLPLGNGEEQRNHLDTLLTTKLNISAQLTLPSNAAVNGDKGRFVALGNFQPTPCGHDQSTLLVPLPITTGGSLQLSCGSDRELEKGSNTAFTIGGIPATLAACIAAQNLTVTWQCGFQSTTRKNWHWLDFKGHRDAAPGQPDAALPGIGAALEAVKKEFPGTRDLGSYPLFDSLFR